MKPAFPILLLAVLTAPGCFAQAATPRFDGFSASINLDFPSLDVRVADPLGNRLGNVNASDQNLVMQIAAGMAVGSKGIATLGISSTIGDMKPASFGPLQLKATASYAVYAELGYVLGTRSMAYGKMSLNQLTATATGGGPGLDETLSSRGSGFGAGYRHMLSDSLYAQAEIMQISYDNVVTATGLQLRPQSTHAMLGIGMQF